MDKHNVLLVVDSIANGGAQKQISLLAVSLKKQGLNVCLAFYHSHSLFYKDFLERHGVSLYSHDSATSKSRLSFVRFLTKVIHSRDIGTTVSFLDAPSIYCALATACSETKLVICKRNFSKYKSGGLLSGWLDRFAMYVAHRVVTNSHAEAEFLVSSGKVNQTKVATIWNGFGQTPVVGKVSNGGGRRLLVAARVAEQKNVLATIEALSLLNSVMGMEISIDWAGSVDCSNEYKEQIEGRLSRSNLKERWRWLGQIDDVTAIFRRYDAFLLPSLYEGLPNALCEAMAVGLPVIATDVCDNRRLLANGSNGVLASSTGPTEIAAAVCHFYSLTAEDVARMTDNARKFVETHLGIDQMAARYHHLLGELHGEL